MRKEPITFAYARTSTNETNLDSQLDALKQFGYKKGNLYIDKGVTGTKNSRPGWDELMSKIESGDRLVVNDVTRLGRKLSLGSVILQAVELYETKGITIITLREGIDTSTTAGQNMMTLYGALAQIERNLILERTKSGREAAKARGRQGGRKKGLSKASMDTAKLAHDMYLLEKSKDELNKNRKDKISVKTMCENLRISRDTFYRYIKIHKESQTEIQSQIDIKYL
jgi:DNA invertase Pin-like site-specific DNA recombinase